MNRKAGLLLIVLPTVWGCGPTKLEERSVAQAIERQLDTLTLAKTSRAIGRQLGTVALASDKQRARENDAEAVALASFYESRENKAVWFDERARPKRSAAELVELLDSAREHGLDPEPYRTAAIDAQRHPEEAALTPDQRAERLAARDLALSRAFLSYGAHLSGGRLEPRETRMNWYADDRPADLMAALDRAANSGDVRKELAALAPAVRAYDALRAALLEYRRLEEQGGWPEVAGDQVLKLGDQGVAVAMLRNRLAVTGELAATAAAAAPQAATALFDQQLEQAVRAFQERHGLEVTGKVDAETRKALNVPVSERIRTIELNLERWRWLPPTLGERYLMVNVPAFELDAIENDASVLRMRVVVGRTVSQTPVLSDTMTHIVVNPSWHVPDGIARKELFPKGAEYLARNNYAIEYDARGVARIRQRPGSNNALGKIKFMFPNHHNIYLHDTPADNLFARTERDFSHGCIRVEHPLVLAEYVLRGDPEWNQPRLASVIGSGSTVDVKLPEQLPVYILYWTAWVDEAGRVQFREDLYGKDKVLDQALRREPRAPAVGSVVASG